MNDPSGGDPAGVVQQQPHSSFGQTDLINGDVTPESDATARFQGNDKPLCGIILGVVTFWLFAQTTLNIAPDMGKDLGLDTSTMNIAVAITALFCGIFIVVMGGLADRVGRVKYWIYWITCREVPR
jgi:sugar phosphate permease